jgi:hypothetical protein
MPPAADDLIGFPGSAVIDGWTSGTVLANWFFDRNPSAPRRLTDVGEVGLPTSPTCTGVNTCDTALNQVCSSKRDSEGDCRRCARKRSHRASLAAAGCTTSLTTHFCRIGAPDDAGSSKKGMSMSSGGSGMSMSMGDMGKKSKKASPSTAVAATDTTIATSSVVVGVSFFAVVAVAVAMLAVKRRLQKRNPEEPAPETIDGFEGTDGVIAVAI